MGRLRRMEDELGISRDGKKYIKWGAIVVGILILVIVLGGMYQTVPKGYYQISQQWFTGIVQAKMTPGFWMPFGPAEDWAKGATYFFTEKGDKDAAGDESRDNTIEVRFKDGSVGHISGTCRYELPTSEAQALELVNKRSYLSLEDTESKLIKPEVRTALRLTASLMTATESYVNRGAFYGHVWEQLQKGPYLTKAEDEWVEDPVTKEKKLTKVTKIVYGKNGEPLHKPNQLTRAGIDVKNIEIKRFVYSPEVNAQIKKQQNAKMAVDIAKANALKAEQDKRTAEAEGRALVAQARAEEEAKKTRAVVVAEKNKDVAKLKAEQALEVAILEKKEAEQKKAAEILLAEGQAKARRLKMEADNLLAKRIDASIQINKLWAQAYSQRKVPAFIMGAGSQNGQAMTGTSGEVSSFQGMINALLANSVIGEAIKVQKAQNK